MGLSDMYRNQPISGTGCRNQTDHWRRRFQFPYKILNLSVLLAACLWWSSAVTAEEGYFTWMDAEGRIHNSPKAEQKAGSDKPAAEQKESSPPSAEKNHEHSEEHEPPAGYLTESELKRALEKEKQDNPPFYIWTDAQGIIHNEWIPVVDQNSPANTEESPPVFYDHTLLPPLRVNAEIRQSACCDGFESAFNDLNEAHNPLVLRYIHRKPPFPARQGQRPAWYFRHPLPPAKDYILRLTLHGSSGQDAALVVVDKALKPLHFIPRLATQYHKKTKKR